VRLLDSSVVLASMHEDEPHHEACSALLLEGGHALYVHALAQAQSRGVRDGPLQPIGSANGAADARWNASR
jgi:predicted nucleic acid-binding protein